MVRDIPLHVTSFAKQSLRLGQLIRHHMAKEYSSALFCAPLLLTSKQSFATRSADPTSHGKGIFLMPLFCAPLLLSKACDSVRSMAKEYSLSCDSVMLIRVKSRSWQRNIPQHCSVHLFCSLRSKACDSVS